MIIYWHVLTAWSDKAPHRASVFRAICLFSAVAWSIWTFQKTGWCHQCDSSAGNQICTRWRALCNITATKTLVCTEQSTGVITLLLWFEVAPVPSNTQNSGSNMKHVVIYWQPLQSQVFSLVPFNVRWLYFEGEVIWLHVDAYSCRTTRPNRGAVTPFPPCPSR